jgi:pectate lyase-like protein
MNGQGIRRRLFLGSAVGALALRPSRTAQADATFTNFSFAATGAPTPRTMPERLSDIINVKDWGAVGNGSTPDSAAIQAAIDYCSSTAGGKPAGGTVFFPNGIYQLTARLSVGSNSVDPNTGLAPAVSLVGCGHDGSRLTGSIDDFMISKGSYTYDGIARVEALGFMTNYDGANSGCIKITRPGVLISAIDFRGTRTQLDASAADGALILGCAAGAGGAFSSDVGMYLGSGCTAIDCRHGGFYIAYALSGNGPNLIACSAEGTNIAIRIGWGPSGEVDTYGATIQGFQTEACGTQIDLYNCNGGFFAAGVLTGVTAVLGNVLNTITNMVWDSSAPHKVTVTTQAAHGLSVNDRIQINCNPAAFVPNAVIDPNMNYVIVTDIDDATHFKYAGPASSPGTFVAAQWGYPPPYGIRCRKVYNTLLTFGSGTYTAYTGMDLEYGGDANAEHKNNVMLGVSSRNGWIMPTTKPGNLAGWQFIAAQGNASIMGGTVATPYGHMTFANLPGQSGVAQQGPFEGQEYDITDGQLDPGGGAAVWNDPIKGGGSGHYKVRYGGSPLAWRRIG